MADWQSESANLPIFQSSNLPILLFSCTTRDVAREVKMSDLRAAAFVLSINKMDVIYEELGICP